MQPVKKTRSELLGNWTFESKFMKHERVNSLLVNCSQEILAANIHKFALQVRLMKGEFVLDIETTNSKCSFAEEQYSLSRVYPVEISRVLEACGIWAMQGVEDTSEPVWTSLTVSECQGFGVQKPAVLLQRSCARGSNRPTQFLNLSPSFTRISFWFLPLGPWGQWGPRKTSEDQRTVGTVASGATLGEDRVGDPGHRGIFRGESFAVSFPIWTNRAIWFELFMGIDITVL